MRQTGAFRKQNGIRRLLDHCLKAKRCCCSVSETGTPGTTHVQHLTLHWQSSRQTQTAACKESCLLCCWRKQLFTSLITGMLHNPAVLFATAQCDTLGLKTDCQDCVLCCAVRGMAGCSLGAKLVWLGCGRNTGPCAVLCCAGKSSDIQGQFSDQSGYQGPHVEVTYWTVCCAALCCPAAG